MLKIRCLKGIPEETTNTCGLIGVLVFICLLLSKDKEDVLFIAIPVGISMLCLIGLWITCILKKHA